MDGVPLWLLVPALAFLTLVCVVVCIRRWQLIVLSDNLFYTFGPEDVETNNAQFCVVKDDGFSGKLLAALPGRAVEISLQPIASTSSVFAMLVFLVYECVSKPEKMVPEKRQEAQKLAHQLLPLWETAKARFDSFRRHIDLLLLVALWSILWMWIYWFLYFGVGTTELALSGEGEHKKTLEIQFARYFAFGLFCAIIDLFAIIQLFGTQSALKGFVVFGFGGGFAVLLTFAALSAGSFSVLVFWIPAVVSVIWKFRWFQQILTDPHDSFVTQVFFLHSTTPAKLLRAHTTLQLILQLVYLGVFLCGDALFQIFSCTLQQCLETVLEQVCFVASAWIVWKLATATEFACAELALNAQKLVGQFDQEFLETYWQPILERSSFFSPLDCEQLSRHAADNISGFVYGDSAPKNLAPPAAATFSAPPVSTNLPKVNLNLPQPKLPPVSAILPPNTPAPRPAALAAPTFSGRQPPKLPPPRLPTSLPPQSHNTKPPSFVVNIPKAS